MTYHLPTLSLPPVTGVAVFACARCAVPQRAADGPFHFLNMEWRDGELQVTLCGGEFVPVAPAGYVFGLPVYFDPRLGAHELEMRAGAGGRVLYRCRLPATERE